ncbi:hypothetical protein GLOIN_2v1663305 [Rhizophagus irregularis DAOM 181602=DAOM 197198]|uniref:Uncharacterized protein n=1 Tax=Rhizophagus irregularis (strain DAOM 181602 / DAOM 197198 / MUCL 43194) TaxID=747089 RepID=A0A2P4PK09_RHIID|nr:hypothetical protein GLOIN_2v1663305 [Rhizophagus irregularis DAOM 181602=DAOM 197198]POG65726.1 hypothetical protein GLOIN_2v1663305 [Rhizophagus irregularis DAOM 181602=DAOM 197198]GET60373.1 hypothetical protein GLOIN_2v1663305 [Rhizophagus irregularis DAOM 181602=DAOM 197198]|eukprot:XP_025172592.1 hypothetical protein GLOIN_2v1663305 [Rhizophagus irregularis DAOM 181602=DAOM 197198]
MEYHTFKVKCINIKLVNYLITTLFDYSIINIFKIFNNIHYHLQHYTKKCKVVNNSGLSILLTGFIMKNIISLSLCKSHNC